jgi:hypothetical protein
MTMEDPISMAVVVNKEIERERERGRSRERRVVVKREKR